MFLETDYLVIGAGAASMAFVDTLLTESPDVSVIVVDRHTQPGGHWNDAYGFVKLHQPSLLYGVASKQLEGSWLKLLAMGVLPWKHRATKTEILSYYHYLMEDWVTSGRVQYFPESSFLFEESKDDIHKFTDTRTHETYQVQVREKLVNGVVGECLVPSKTPPKFHVEGNINLLTPNQIYDLKGTSNSFWSFSTPKHALGHYIILGAGKTAMDTIVFLQRDLKVAADNISWVIPNDIWIIRRDGAGSPWSWGQALLDNDLDVQRAALDLEQKGTFTRLDKTITPTKFRFPLVGDDEMAYLRRVKHVIRQGRVKSLAATENGQVRVIFDAGEPWLVNFDQVFVHCSSPGPFNGTSGGDPFVSKHQINLESLYAPPVPISMSCIAALESRRRQGKLDILLGSQLLMSRHDEKEQAPATTAHDVLTTMICGRKFKQHLNLDNEDLLQPIVTLAAFVALFDVDAAVGHEWLRSNRLSFFSIPGFKGNVHESLCQMIEKQDVLGLSDKEVALLRLLVGKLGSLKEKL